jgi:Flp pilus assembly protein TadG
MTARRDRSDRERGSATFILIMWALILWLLLAIVVDAGLAISQREQAADIADQAARAEAQNLSLQTLLGQGKNTKAAAPVIEKDYCARASAYIATAASSVHLGTVSLDKTFGNEGDGNSPDGCELVGNGPGNSVTVSVNISYTPVVFDFFGLLDVTANETGTATVAAGTN